MNNFNYVNLTPFKWYVRENFPFIEAEFDAMTNWDLFCKLGKEINKIIDSQNLVGEQAENLTNAFNELQNYVNNYFENLDVQEEINNKLDEMVEDGTLEEIITTYLNISAMLIFDTMQEMINSERLINGSTCEILGYYAKNDGGKGIFKIRNVTNQDATNNYNLIALSNENLVAELIEKEKINIIQCGAKGDGITDDTTAIQNAFDNYKNIYIPNGTYMINAITSVKPKSNSIINFDKNAKLKAITNDATNYSIISIEDEDNICINGGIIEGERDTHTGVTGAWGMGISIIDGSKNIYIKNTIIKNCWGDGIYINNAENINTENIICDNNRRQGMSIISVNGYHSLNDRLINTNGTKPESGIDIEPNYDTDIIKNIVLENLYTANNNGEGLQIYLMPITSNENKVDITVINHTDKGSNRGLTISKTPTSNGFIKIIDSNYIDNIANGINCRKCYDSNLKVDIIRPRIINANANSQSGVDQRTAFQMTEGISQYSDYPLGGVRLYEPWLDQTINLGENINVQNIYARNLTNTNLGINDFKIINPLYLSNPNIWADKITNCLITDKYKVTISDVDENVNITSSRIRNYYYNSNYTEERIITFTSQLPENVEIIFEGRNSDYPIKINMYNSSYVYGLSNHPIRTSEITVNKGGILKIRRVNYSDYYAEANNLNLVTIQAQT